MHRVQCRDGMAGPGWQAPTPSPTPRGGRAPADPICALSARVGHQGLHAGELLRCWGGRSVRGISKLIRSSEMVLVLRRESGTGAPGGRASLRRVAGEGRLGRCLGFGRYSPGRGDSSCKGPETGLCLLCSWYLGHLGASWRWACWDGSPGARGVDRPTAFCRRTEHSRAQGGPWEVATWSGEGVVTQAWGAAAKVGGSPTRPCLSRVERTC